ncbi:sugar transferase [Haloplanus rubicundus]|uniref:Sugar transferase n=1 Tax=Haloplanus rubicundus TaxID=1547898 RepID=A0A345E260_9EURY|nr:sugar transferase [Haloplanus rubicundus]AXG06282.1 sugar transferase [Haloplanus rubicundus]
MERGWRYRGTSVLGVVCLTAFAVGIVNNSTIQTLAMQIPILNRLPTDPPVGLEYTMEILVTTAVMAGVFIPLYKPRPRRALDIVFLVHKRVLVGSFALAAIGYFDYSYRLPRLTVVLVTPLLLIVLPLWFVGIRQQPASDQARALLVGDDPDLFTQIVPELDLPIVGYLAPTRALLAQSDSKLPATDGGALNVDLERLGGLSRIEDVLVEQDIDTVVLAFDQADRAEFFGVLDACYEHGVNVKAHREHTDSVLVPGDAVGTIVDVEIEPWDLQDHLIKRGFDLVFATVGLVCLFPVCLGIAIAIKLEDGGSILYQQERTALFGDRFDVYKFRSMIEDAEAHTGATISEEDAGDIDPRVTRVGRVLRQTHLDEIPQLWSVLKGDMSVVGPRPERPELESDIQAGVGDWQKRWFVKPGLTGPAQVHGVTGADPDTKIRYDLEYVRNQSFPYDLQLVVMQILKVLRDALAGFRSNRT